MARLADFGFRFEDTVVLTADVGMRGFIKAGTTGTICSPVLKDGFYVRVQLDMEPDGRLHSCDHRCPPRTGFNIDPRNLKIFANEDNFDIANDDIFMMLGGVAV